MKALKGAFIDHVVNSTGKSTISGTRLRNLLNDQQFAAAGKSLFTPDEFAQLEKIASDLGRVQMPTHEVAHLLSVAIPAWKTAGARMLGLRAQIPGVGNGLAERAMQSNLAKKVFAPDPTPRLQEQLRATFENPDALIGALRIAGGPVPASPSVGSQIGGLSAMMPKSQKDVIAMANPLLTAIMGSGTVAANTLLNGGRR
jgi:hypothetical protein